MRLRPCVLDGASVIAFEERLDLLTLRLSVTVTVILVRQ